MIYKISILVNNIKLCIDSSWRDTNPSTEYFITFSHKILLGHWHVCKIYIVYKFNMIWIVKTKDFLRPAYTTLIK